MLFIGLITALVFAQSGSKYTHGNFKWGYQLALTFIYTFSIIKYFEIYSILNKKKKIILAIILSYQVTIGCIYIIKILKGHVIW